ncbi:hypothetical protein SmJEL517_g04459 [Synchytrium microbalum]|uniref:Sodium/potassium exporting P-type ATPase 1 n=1 Tax=Synchytrium microbalum TaxID=1806994 RepID=A0A507C3C1_9FUNG|nr:uncharacterized protein SmJEL517_g04459 [Synchytrium microbalum]TPX32446.1 hypothetical protein SmJEL517_g04459 [Synchytrium microbalum]
MATSPGGVDSDLRSVSVYLDGRASIEHQIDIHVIDLSEVADNKDILLLDVLNGIRYVMDYRIQGGKMTHLDGAIMERLCRGLLLFTRQHEGSLLKQRPTQEADLAFVLFGEFIEEVEEFRHAVSQTPTTDLMHSLKIDRRCQPWSTPEQKQAAATILGLLTSRFSQFRDWHELVQSDEHGDVDVLMKEYEEKFKRPTMPMPSKEDLYPPPALYFDKNGERLAEMYRTDIKNGLSSSVIPEFTAFYGSNMLPPPPKPSPLKMLWEQVSDFMIVILVIAAIAEGASGDPKGMAVLLIVVVINVIIGFSQEWKANQALEALMSLSVPKASVIRDGKQQVIDSKELVPGDVVVLDEGDAVPADLRLVEVSGLELVESILTGESVPTVKSIRTIRQRTRKLPLGDCKSNAFMATVVARGRGKGIVVRTGEQTEMGKISKALTSQKSPKTPIQIKLANLGKWLVVLSAVLCILIVIIGLAYRRPALVMIEVGISLAVSVIPEGLVAVVTVTMALGVRRMATQNAIVRKLASVETLGSVTVICSDKTGTLTEGKMGTAEMWTSDNSSFIFTHSTSLDPSIGGAQRYPWTPLPDILSDPKGPGNWIAHTKDQAVDVPKDVAKAPAHLVVASMVATLCNNSRVNWDEENKKWKPIGDPTEVAMVVAAQKSGFPREWFEEKMKLGRVCENPFDSDRKIMSVLVKRVDEASKSNGDSNGTSHMNGNGAAVPAEGDIVDHVAGKAPSDGQTLPPGTAFVLVKGAPEAVLHKCVSYLPSPDLNTSATSPHVSFVTLFDHAQPEPLSDAFVDYVSEASSKMAARGLRVLALALRQVNEETSSALAVSKNPQDSERELCFVGLIGLIDPAKEGVKESVASCKAAGIRVIMITGDHVATATAIAKQLGIIDPENPILNRAMKGYEVDLLSEEQLGDLRPFPVVFARVSPDNKLKIVTALQAIGQAVSMTGDGVNDAPAIKKADVGVAMGIGGTEITKQAADIVLADDNFSTIVAAVKEGRRVFDNIKKFIVYLLSCNSAEIWLFLICAVIDVDLPFITIQILYANIIADIPPAMSLGLEPPETDIMDRPPRPPNQSVLTPISTLLVLSQGLIQSLLSFGAYMLARGGYIPTDESLISQRSLAFATLTTLQLWQSFLSRSVEASVFTTGVIGNKWMIGAFLLSFLCLLLGLYLPGFSDWLELGDIHIIGWGVCLACVVIQTVCVELLKLWARTAYARGWLQEIRFPWSKRKTTSFVRPF